MTMNRKSLLVAAVSLIAFGCCRNSGPDRILTSVKMDLELRTVVEDIATGEVLSDDTESIPTSQQTFEWTDRTMKNTYSVNGSQVFLGEYTYGDQGLLCADIDEQGTKSHVEYRHEEGRLVELKTEKETIGFEYDADGLVSKFSDVLDDSVEAEVESWRSKTTLGTLEFRDGNVVKSVMEFFDFRGGKIEGSDRILECTFDDRINPLKYIMGFHTLDTPHMFFSKNNALHIHQSENGMEIDVDNTYEYDGDYPASCRSCTVLSREMDGKRKTMYATYVILYGYQPWKSGPVTL